jgi:hypothetical protein
LPSKFIASADTARDIVLKYIIYLANDGERLGHFCGQHMIAPAELKQRLDEPIFQGFIFDCLLADEQELVAFASDQGVAPENMLALRAKLPGFSP